MKILFISRAHPPVIGGIENQNAAVKNWLIKNAEVISIVNTKGKRLLPLFIPWAVIKSLYLSRKVDVILLGDGVLAFVAWALKILHVNKPIVAIMHGLDVTYASPMYQKFWVKQFFSSVDDFIAVSRSTADILSGAGVQAAIIHTIPNGVDLPVTFTHNKESLSAYLGFDISKRKVLLTVGRLVKRKGVSWFLENVIPELPEEYIYLIAGDGPERERIEKLVDLTGCKGKAIYLGRIEDEIKTMLYSASDLFVQPNICVPGDAEGFGIAVIEAGSFGLPVLAADLEGLKDSVNDEENGWRVQPLDAGAYIYKILDIFSEPEKISAYRLNVRRFVEKNYDWRIVIRRYLEVLGSIMDRWQQTGSK